MTIRRQAPLVTAALLALLLALVPRAAIPAGYMLAPATAGSLHLMLCDGVSGPASQHDGAGKGDSPCPFLLVAAPVLPGTPSLVPPPPLPAPPLRAMRRDAIAAPPRAIGLRPPATGPPLA